MLVFYGMRIIVEILIVYGITKFPISLQNCKKHSLCMEYCKKWQIFIASKVLLEIIPFYNDTENAILVLFLIYTMSTNTKNHSLFVSTKVSKAIS